MGNCKIGNGKTFKRQSVIATGLMVALTALAVTGAAPELSWADQHLRNLKRPVTVQLDTPVQSVNTTTGQPFAAKLAEPVHYKNMTLPAGTEFRGHISKVQHSRHFGRPGYVILQTDSATLPNGQTLNLESGKYEPRNRALHHPDTETFVESVAIQVPYTMCSLAVTLPLLYGTEARWQPLLIVGEGVRMLVGSLFGLVRPKFRNEPVPRKIALGALDGSGVPRVMNFLERAPEPDYKPGDQVKLYLPPQGLNDLFRSSQTTVLPSPAPQPTAQAVAAQTTAAQATAKVSGLSLTEPLPLK
jgi:hypothetical protein